MTRWIVNEWKRTPRWLLVLLFLIDFTAIGAVAPLYMKLVVLLGRNIPQQNIQLDYMKGIFWALILGLTIFIWPIRSQDKKPLFWIWVMKCTVMLGFMLFYEFNYILDSFNYFRGARLDMSVWKASASTGANFPPVFISWLHQHSFFDSFHATKISFGLIGLVGTYVFYRAVVAFLKYDKVSLLYFFALFPSILFWSSILGKEPIIFLFIAIYCFGVARWFQSGLIVHVGTMLAAVFIVGNFRDWMGPIMILPVIIGTLRFSLKSKKIKMIALALLCLAFVLSVNKFMDHFKIHSTRDLTDQATIKSNDFASGGSSFKNAYLESSKKKGQALLDENIGPAMAAPAGDAAAGESSGRIQFNSLKEMVFYVPKGIFTVLFRPFIGDVNNLFGFLAGIEGSFVIILFALAIKRFRWRRLLEPTIIWAVAFILTWSVLYAFIGFNLGSVCRYRLQILPVFLGLLMYLFFVQESPANKKNNGCR